MMEQLGIDGIPPLPPKRDPGRPTKQQAKRHEAAVARAKAPRFNGADYDPVRDTGRLNAQLNRIWALMKDSVWRTLDEIAGATGDPQASISAQLRHLRKPRFGAHTVNRVHIKNGLYRYQLVPSEAGRITSVPEPKP